MTDYEDTSGRTLYITGAGVSADSGIPTFAARMATGPSARPTTRRRRWPPARCISAIRGSSSLWYYRRFASYRNVPPNDVHRWLAAECNSGRANLITQNIDGLDGRAGNRDYVCIHGAA